MAEEASQTETPGKKPGKRFSIRLPKFPHPHIRKKGQDGSPPAQKKEKKKSKPSKPPKDEKYIKSISEIFRDFKEKDLAKERFAVLGLGNDLKGDDGVGFYVVDRLRKALASDANMLLIKTAVPENHVRQLRDFSPSMLIIVDAADFGKKPGKTRVIEERQISSVFISTHTTPLTLFLKLYQADQPTKSGVTIIGIQRKSSEFGQPMGEAVRKAGDLVASTILGLYSKGVLATSLTGEISRASSPFARIADSLRKSKSEAEKEPKSAGAATS